MSQKLKDALPDGWQGAYLAALGSGQTVAQASERCGVSVAHLYRLRTQDNNFRTDWDEAKRIARLVRAEKAWSANDELVADPHHRDHFAAVKLAIEKNDPDAQPTLELTGNVDVTHRRGYMLADLLALAATDRDAGLGGGARGELPAAPDVLAPPQRG